MNRRGFLQSGLAMGTLAALRPALARAGSDRFLIVYWNNGGWDPAMLFDPHFESSIPDRGDCEEDSVNGLTFAHSDERPSVREFLDTWGGQTAFVNGIAVGSISHAKCTRQVLTGSRLETAPDLPTLVAAHTGSALALPHLVLSGPRYPGDLGAYMVPLSPTLTGTMTGASPETAIYSPASEALIRSYLADTIASRALVTPSDYLDDYQTAIGHLDALEAAAPALNIEANADADTLLEKGLLAMSAGLTRSLIIQGSLPGYGSWDSHIENSRQQSACYEHTFEKLLSLMSLLQATTAPGGGSLLEQTTLLVLSEMGRTPSLNTSQGKDHWPYTSAMLVGASVIGGRSYGVTDETLVGQSIDMSTGEASDGGETLSAGSFIAGVLSSFGVDTEAYLPGVTTFTAPFS